MSLRLGVIRTRLKVEPLRLLIEALFGWTIAAEAEADNFRLFDFSAYSARSRPFEYPERRRTV